MQRWEHKVTLDEEDIYKLGEKGWELVSVVTIGHSVRFYLKRPAPTLKEQITLDQRKEVLASKNEQPAAKTGTE